MHGGFWYNIRMFATLALLCSLAFAESKTLALQISLDQAGFSCNTIDGVWGGKSQRALERYCRSRNVGLPATAEEAYDSLFADKEDLFRIEAVTQEDLDSLTPMPKTPAEKAKLPAMNYGSIREMFAERGHLSLRALERMNPGVDWNNVTAGLKLVIPNFPSADEELSAWPRRPRGPKRPVAALVRVSLSRLEISVLDEGGREIALFPCSIARNKANRPPKGELKIVGPIARPNYTYTPDFVPRGKKAEKFILPPGPRCPVGVCWLGLNLPTYGIHGTPKPETIGRAESHGCFRLSNWNAARLYAMVKPGTRVLIEQ